MTPEQHFEFIFNAFIEETEQMVLDRNAVTTVLDTDPGFDLDDYMQPVIMIKMGKSDYNNFVISYGKYLEVVHAVDQDLELRKMYSKFLTMMYLKR